MGFKLFSVSKDNKIPSSEGKQIVEDISNWYSDRYGKVLIQRNLLVIIVLISAVAIIATSFNLGMIAMSNKIAPIVVEIEDKTGIPTIVNPLSSGAKELSTNEVLNRYFVIRYVRSREAYCDVSYKYNFFTVVRLLSSYTVYDSFKNFVNNSPNSPLVKYGTGACTDFELRSIQFLSADKGITNVVVRFNIINRGNREPKIATLNYQYFQNKMTYNERLENPLGFTIVSYNSVDELNVIVN